MELLNNVTIINIMEAVSSTANRINDTNNLNEVCLSSSTPGVAKSLPGGKKVPVKAFSCALQTFFENYII